MLFRIHKTELIKIKIRRLELKTEFFKLCHSKKKKIKLIYNEFNQFTVKLTQIKSISKQSFNEHSENFLLFLSLVAKNFLEFN